MTEQESKDYMMLLDETAKLNKQRWELKDRVDNLEYTLRRRDEQLANAREEVNACQARINELTNYYEGRIKELKEQLATLLETDKEISND